MTGALVPAGADAVIMVEQTTEHDGQLQIGNQLRRGENIHVVGQDIAQGTLVLPRGTMLTAADIGLLTTIGQTQISVYRKPHVAVLATGDEVQEPDQPRNAGGIRDSNR